MSLKLESVRLVVNTTNSQLKYEAAFEDGLNVIAAPNSFGKSTLLQSIIYALGLEGMLSASHSSPVGPVMTTVADLPDGVRESVVESFVELTISNRAGQKMAMRRFARSLDVDTNLIQVWKASGEESFDASERIDTFVRLGGAATNELGFQRILVDFLGWSIPQVPSFNESEVPLYLEAIFPLFYVEQKAGWSGITPRMPTYLRIKNMLTRSVEFVLGLGTLDRLKALDAIKREQDEIRRQWNLNLDRVRTIAISNNLRLGVVSVAPTSAADRHEVSLLALGDGSEWVPLERATVEWAEQLQHLRAGEWVSTVGERASIAQEELNASESEYRKLSSNLHHLNEQRILILGDLDSLASRLASVDSDRRRLGDVVRLRKLGSDLHMELIAHDSCPTCHQFLGGQNLEGTSVATVETTLDLASAEKVTLEHMQAAAKEREDRISSAASALAEQLNLVRDRIRILRDELVEPASMPSVATIQAGLVIENRLVDSQRASALIASADDDFARLSEQWEDMRRRQKLLESTSGKNEDAAAVARFESSFVDQLGRYGLRSLPPNQVAIDKDTLVPINDGVELSFDLAMGISASDTIRTKWAYHLALLESAATDPRAHHSNLLIFDEPRQQETDRTDLRAFIERLGLLDAEKQVVYATSEEPEALRELLADVMHTMLPSSGAHLLAVRS